MTNTSITLLVAACAGVFSLGAYLAWVLMPAWSAYSRVWQRLSAAFLSLYVLLSLVGLGGAAGVAVILYWDRLF
jgi:hypothetical protein